LLLGAVGQKAEMMDAHEIVGQDMELEATEKRILGDPEFIYRAARRGSHDAKRWQQLLESCKP